MTTTENLIERDLIAKLEDLKSTYRPDIRDRAALEKNFREKFETLNRIRLTDAEFQSLLEQSLHRMFSPPPKASASATASPEMMERR